MMLGAQITLLVLTLLTLTAQVLFARRVGGTLGLLLTAQAVFWTLGFVLRPAFMIFVKPVDRDLLADPRLAVTNYGAPMTEILAITLVGFVTYLLAVAAFTLCVPAFSNRETPRAISPSESPSGLILAGVVLLTAGWAGRAALLAGIGGLIPQLQPMAVTGSVLLIVALRQKANHNSWVAVVVGTEVFWAFQFESKAALIIPVLAVMLRWILQRRADMLSKFAPGLAVLAALGFFTIQAARGILTGDDVAAIQGSVGGGVVAAYFVGLLQRFDGFSSVTDAVYLGGMRWQSPQEYFSRIGENLLPKLGSTQTGSNGQLWTREVRAYSIPNQFLDVPIAAGPTAEGYAMWGTIGVIALNITMSIFILALARAIDSGKVLAVIFGISMTFNTGFFEIGLQGWAGQVNKSLQALAVVLPFLCVYWMVRDIALRPSYGATFATFKPSDALARKGTPHDNSRRSSARQSQHAQVH